MLALCARASHAIDLPFSINFHRLHHSRPQCSLESILWCSLCRSLLMIQLEHSIGIKEGNSGDSGSTVSLAALPIAR